MALKVCSTNGCPQLVPAGTGRCDECKAEAERRRGTAASRGYDSRHERRFRRLVLVKNPLCVCEDPTCSTHGAQCLRPSQHADHWPVDQRTLVRRGQNPYDPRHGRGLCAECHSHHTSIEQPGGWNAR